LEAALVAVLVAKLRRLIILVEKTRDRSILFIAATTEPLLTRALVERASRQTPAGRAGGPCVLRAGGGWVVWAVGACGRGPWVARCGGKAEALPRRSSPSWVFQVPTGGRVPWSWLAAGCFRATGFISAPRPQVVQGPNFSSGSGSGSSGKWQVVQGQSAAGSRQGVSPCRQGADWMPGVRLRRTQLAALALAPS
jgi:hypothetical protein